MTFPEQEWQIGWVGMNWSDESSLREKVREAIKAGQLPNRRPDRTWGGTGSGRCCTICGVPVPPHEAEMELEFDDDGDGSAQVDVRVHPRCLAAWELELEQQRQPAERGPDMASTRRVLPGAEKVGSISDRGRDRKYDWGSG